MLIKDKKLNLVNLALMIYVFSIIVFNEGSIIIKIVKVIFVFINIVYILSKNKLYIDKYAIWMILFTAFCAISIIWATSKENARSMLTTITLNNICIFFIINLIYEDKRRIQFIFNSIIVSSIILGLKTAIEYGPFIFINGTRGGKDGLISANTIGMISAISSVISIYLIKTKKVYKSIYLFSFIANMGIMILSASRKAILFLVIPLVILYIMDSKNIVKTIGKILMSIIIITSAFLLIMKIPFLYNSVGSRIETMIQGFLGEKTDDSTHMRFAMIEWGIEWFNQKPLLGYGIDNYKNLFATRNTYFGASGVYAHNNYIELLVDVGIVGTLIYYSIYILMLWKGILKVKSKELLKILMFGILVAYIINEYGFVSYYSKFCQLIIAIIWMVLCSKLEERKENEKN